MYSVYFIGPSPSTIDADTKKRLNEKENEVESFIQFPGLSNSFTSLEQLNQQDILLQNYSPFSSKEIFNKDDATEEDIDHLLTDLFNEDGVELPTPGEIGRSSFLESTENLSSVSNNNQGSGNDVFKVESWQLLVHNEFDWQNYDFPDVDQMEDQDVLDARGLIVPIEISNKTQSSLQVEESSVETEDAAVLVHGGDGGDGDGVVHDVFVGQDTSSLDQEIKMAVEIPSVEDKKDKIIVNIEVLPEKINEIVVNPETQSEVYLNKSQIKAEVVEEIIRSEPQPGDIQEEPKEAVQVGAETKESPVKSDNDPAWSDGSVVRAGRGRKRKPGTVVDLLVSSYARKRNTRCKVGAAPSPTDCNKV